jgi:DNA polymerase III delta subunit
MKQYPPSIKDFIDFDKNGGIFFIHSVERFVIKSMKEELKTSFNKECGTEVVIYDADDSKDAVIDAVNTSKELGFFCTRKIIILDLSDKMNDKNREILENYLDTFEVNNHLVVFASEIDKRTKFFKNLQKLTSVYFPVPPPSPQQLRTFIKNQFEPFSADDRLADFFTLPENSDLFYIYSEIEKIKLYAMSKGKSVIKWDFAEQIINGLSEQIIFRIMDMLISGQKSKAIELYRETLNLEGEYKVNPLLTSMFFKHFKALMKGRILLKDRKTADFSKYLTQNRLFYLKRDASRIVSETKNLKVVSALRELSEIELGMKGVYELKRSETASEMEQFMVKYF